MPMRHVDTPMTPVVWTEEQLRSARIGNHPRERVEYVETRPRAQLHGPTCGWCGCNPNSLHSNATQLHKFRRWSRYEMSWQYIYYCDSCIIPCAVTDTPDQRVLIVGPGNGFAIWTYENTEHGSENATGRSMQIAFNAEGVAPVDALHSCDNCGRWVQREADIVDDDGENICHTCNYDRERERRRIIRGYHSGTRNGTPIQSGWSKRRKGLYFGVELEVELRNTDTCDCELDEDGDGCECRGSSLERDEAAQNVMNALASNAGPVEEPLKRRRDVIRFEEDGSLDNGFEIITLPFSLPEQRHIWNTILKDSTVRRELISHQTDTCGLHIHVSRAPLTTSQIARMNYFINRPDNEQLIRAVARRYNTSFARVTDKTLENGARATDRYEMLNLLNPMTIEFRMFRGSCNPDAVVAALEFVNALVKYTEDGRAWWDSAALPKGRNAHVFLNYLTAPDIRRETQTLRRYLKERGVVWTKNTWGRMRNSDSPTAEG